MSFVKDCVDDPDDDVTLLVDRLVFGLKLDIVMRLIAITVSLISWSTWCSRWLSHNFCHYCQFHWQSYLTSAFLIVFISGAIFSELNSNFGRKFSAEINIGFYIPFRLFFRYCRMLTNSCHLHLWFNWFIIVSVILCWLTGVLHSSCCFVIMTVALTDWKLPLKNMSLNSCGGN